MLNATLLAGAGAVIMTPDTPLLFFWTCCLWALVRLLHSGRPAWWLAIGVFAGLALASKYTALLLWIGIGFGWSGCRRCATGGGRRCCGPERCSVRWSSCPVVLWNAAHGWASFLRQGGRVDDWQPARAGQFLGELVGGQFGLATPLVFLLLLVGVGWAARRAWRDRDPAWRCCAALTLPGAVLFVQHALGDRVQGNWPAILYPAAAIAAAGLHSRRWLRLRWPAVALGLAITLLVYVQATSFVLPFPPRIDPIARELAGWDGLARSVDAARQAPGRRLRCRGRLRRRGRAGPRTARRRDGAWRGPAVAAVSSAGGGGRGRGRHPGTARRQRRALRLARGAPDRRSDCVRAMASRATVRVVARGRAAAVAAGGGIATLRSGDAGQETSPAFGGRGRDA